jgi:hypothetical protein
MQIQSKYQLYFVNLVATLLIFLFIYTASNKLSDVEAFRTVLSKSPLLKEIAIWLAWTVPLVEVVISLLLLIPKFRSAGLLLSSLLMAAFSVYILYMLLFVPHLPCSCGGIIQQMNWTQHFIFNLVMFLLSFYGWKITRQKNKIFIAINRVSRTPV